MRDPAAEAIWHEIRRQVWERDSGRCVLCQVDVSLESSNCHHRQLKRRGGSDEHPNLITLCTRRCHIPRVHAFPAWATVTGFQVPSWTTPEAWPVLYRPSPFVRPLWAVPALVNGRWEWQMTPPHPDQHDEPGPWQAIA